MAEVCNNASDFILFPQDHPFLDTFDPRSDKNFDGLHHSRSPANDMHRQRDISGHANTSYEQYPPISAYSSAYYGASTKPFEAPQGIIGQPLRRNPSSGSPSPSVSQGFDHPSSTLSSASGASAQSTASSADGSPYASATQGFSSHERWPEPLHGLGIATEIVSGEGFNEDHFPPSTFENDLILEGNKFPDYVDPSLIQHYNAPIAQNTSNEPYPGVIHAFPHHLPSQTFQPPSPAASEASSQDSHGPGSSRFRNGTGSPYIRRTSYQPYPQNVEARRFSIASSRNSHESPGSNSYIFDDDGKERTRCPHPDCGRPFKDLKAHMLTHQSERPEKCPIINCAYHHKGFARKYDKNRHTLTHYKGNMVCGFCPGSGSALEKSFNRADVFKRHLTSVHGVEQTPPNSRKKSPNPTANKKLSAQAIDASGKCSTCSATFKNAQDFYEHLDDCVLRVVQQEEPSEAINEQHLGAVASDDAVQETMDRHMIPAETQDVMTYDDDQEDANLDDSKDESSEDSHGWSPRTDFRSGKGEIASRRGNSC